VIVITTCNVLVKRDRVHKYRNKVSVSILSFLEKLLSARFLEAHNARDYECMLYGNNCAYNIQPHNIHFLHNYLEISATFSMSNHIYAHITLTIRHNLTISVLLNACLVIHNINNSVYMMSSQSNTTCYVNYVHIYHHPLF